MVRRSPRTRRLLTWDPALATEFAFANRFEAMDGTSTRLSSYEAGPMTAKLLEAVFRNCEDEHGLGFFENGEPERLKFQTNGARIELWCPVRRRWKKATPEEVVRQCFIIWIQETLKYPLSRLQVEHRLQRGSDADRERVDIVVFSDDACADRFILFELKKPDFKDGLEQLRSYLRWSGCFFGAWSNGNDYSFQLREEDPQTRKAPYTYRDIPRLPAYGQDISDVLTPLSFGELRPIHDLRSLVYRLEHDALSNAGVTAFDELFKLFFAKLHDELRPRRRDRDPVDFRVPVGDPDLVHQRINGLFLAAKRRANWDNIFDKGEELKLKGDALRLCAAALEPFSLMKTDLEVVDAAFEYLINPEQKGQKGQYFTPRPVVKMAVEMLHPREGERVIDPACGSCGFLIHTINYVRRSYKWSDAEVYRYANEYLFGVDFDERLTKVAKTMMIIAGDGKANVFQVNALDAREWQNSEAAFKIGPLGRDQKDGDFDIVLTNPPFAGKVTGRAKLNVYELFDLARSGQLVDETEQPDEDDEHVDAPREKTVNAMKRDVLFIERGLKLLKPGGRMAIVLPQGILNNLGTASLRQWLQGKARLLGAVGLPYFTFRPFASIKTAVLLLQKWGGDAGPPRENYEVFLAINERSCKDNRGNYIYKRDKHGNLIDDNGAPVRTNRLSR
jgi:type I restriction enzyme M protein